MHMPDSVERVRRLHAGTGSQKSRPDWGFLIASARPKLFFPF